MKAAVSDILAARAHDDGGLSRLVGWSLAVHLVAGSIAIFLPSGWLATQPEKPEIMVISLGGAVGPRSTGTAPIAGRQVDVVPETPRPQPPAPPAATRPDTIPPPQTKPVIAKPTPPQTTKAPPAATTKPPVVGAKVQTGTAAADTGASGTSTGLTLTGGGGGGDANLSNFDPEWTAKFRDAINRVWQQNQPVVGYVVLRFTIRRDGTLEAGLPQVIESSRHFQLEMASRRALLEARLPPLPASYVGNEMVVRLRFDYEKR
ncbi:MAG: energy transducer TonB [Acidobacteria bacterium]|nr:energy transducer TonB [Acidobacteriota bacterium]